MSRYFVGLDLGQSADYTACAVLERYEDEEKGLMFRCRHLQRWPLRTSYPSIVADVARMMDDKELHGEREPVLAIDATGVGAPVVDLFKHGNLRAELMPIQITGGDTVRRADGVTRVPKRDLVGAAKVALQTERLRIAPELPEAQTLVRELDNFQHKINPETAHDSYAAWREGAHDDLVLAVAMALWQGEQPTPRFFSI